MIDFEGVIERGSRDDSLLRQIDPRHLPKHLAVIMDGNGRWAAQRGKPRVSGHRMGAEAVRETVETSARLGIEALTLYAFSVDNWKRPRYEIITLMNLLREFLQKELENIHRNNIRFTTIGRIDELDPTLQRELACAQRQTAFNTGMVMNVAINYGGRTEMVDACRKVCAEILRAGGNPEEIDERMIARHIYTSALPDPDLLIRTSGEMRVSNFLLWQIAYTEIYITERLWPDFRRADLFEAILAYQKRERRYGGLSVESEAVSLAKG